MLQVDIKMDRREARINSHLALKWTGREV